MKNSHSAFTLIETLVSTFVLSFIVVLASQITSATLDTVSQSTYTLDSSERVRAATQMLRDELGAAVASTRPDRFLNLMITEDQESVALYFTVPRASTADLTRMGFVTHVVYVWDREARTLGRAEYHSSRDPDTVCATGKSVDSTNVEANLDRLRTITPAYQGEEPYAWTTQPFWADRLAEARRNPLLTGVSDWRLECFQTTKLDTEKPVENLWDTPGRLPSVVRFGFTVQAKHKSASGRNAVGRRYESIVTLPCVEAASQ